MATTASRDPAQYRVARNAAVHRFVPHRMVLSRAACVIGTATIHLIGPLRSLAAGSPLEGPALARLTLSLGAGLYEELLFRVVIVALISNGLRVIGFGQLIAGTVAVIVGALLFSAFHYIGPFGEPLRLESFVFRTLAGLAFSALYLTRGFGITAWTHALYDVAVLM